MFTRQHYNYKAIAAIVNGATHVVLKYHNPDGGPRPSLDKEGLTDRLADYFAQDNPHFDRERFLEACGL